jgi:hypothetical protein
MPLGDEATGQTMRLLRGSRLITDWESRYPSEEALAPLEKRKQSRVAARLLELSRTYRLASREMSLVAVVKRASDRAGELPETRVVPVGMPQNTKFGAYFRPTSTGNFAIPAPRQAMPSLPYVPPPASPMPTPMLSMCIAPSGVETAQAQPGLFTRLARALHRRQPTSKPAERESDEDKLLEIAAQLEPDGGMPGGDASERVARTVAVVLAFVAAGHTLGSGAFRTHVARLAGFLKAARGGASDREGTCIDAAVAAASGGKVVANDWLTIADSTGGIWRQIEEGLRL